MPYRICKSFDIESGHMLAKHPDKCRFPHGHTRSVEIVLEAETLDDRDMVCDFKVVRELVGAELERLDHAICMNTRDAFFPAMRAEFGDRVIAFEGTDPTTEVMAERLFRLCEAALAERAAAGDGRYPVRPGVRLVRLRLWETATSWAEYEAR